MPTPEYPRVDSSEYLEMRARSTDPATSHEAAKKVDAASQRGRIMEVLRGETCARWGLPADPKEGGWTADEIDAALHWGVTTAGRRLSELLKHDPPLVEVCGERLTRSNRLAQVYRAVS